MHLISLFALSAALLGYLYFLRWFFSMNSKENSLGIIFLGVFTICSMTMIENVYFIAPYILICILWLPLSIQDIKTNSVSFQFLVLSLLGTLILSVYFKLSSLTGITLTISVMISVRALVFAIEKLLNKQLIGGADYFAAVAFVSTLQGHTIGYWIICFSIFGILHGLLHAGYKKKIPLFPFMTSAWCFVFSVFN